MDEVLLAKIQSDLTKVFNLLNIESLAALFSNIASITKSTSSGIFSIPKVLLIFLKVLTFCDSDDNFFLHLTIKIF